MATKYVSALTGPQMDSALLDMANHNSEAYAIGERGGVAVSAGDVTYHNNAKYYASQTGADAQAAEAAAARAEAAVPSTTAGAVFFDRAQSLTTAQQSQARANIMAGGTNPNLLDNAYFVGGGSQLGDGVFPINQRGQTAYTGANAYTFDRWKQQYNTNTQLLSNGLRVYGDWDINQTVLENLPTGEPYTLSVKYTNLSGTDGLHLFAYNSSLQTIFEVWTHEASGIFTHTFTPQTQIKTIALGYRGGGDGDVVLQAAKLEKGTVSTLANDVPPNFFDEKKRCQSYLWHKTFGGNTQIGCGPAIDASTAIIDVVVPASMRATPTVAFTASVLLVGNGVVVIAASVIGINEYDNHLRLVVSATGLTAYQVYSLLATTTTTMTVSAEP